MYITYRGITNPNYSSITEADLITIFGPNYSKERITLDDYNSKLAKFDKTVLGSIISAPEINFEKNDKPLSNPNKDCTIDQYIDIMEDMIRTLASDNAKGS